MMVANRIGNAKAYKNIYMVLNRYRNNRDFTFQDFDYKFLEDFEKDYRSRGNSTNALCFVFRQMRAVYNRAAKNGLAKPEDSPFNYYKIRVEETKKRAINLTDIEKINQGEGLNYGSKEWHARNYFMLSFAIQGISFIDLAYLKMSDIIGDFERIQYRRRKTHKLISVPIGKGMKDILDNYINYQTDDEYILPIIKNKGNPQREYQDVKYGLREYNLSLKKLASKYEIKANLTSYVARHSFASVLNEQGVSAKIIGQFLGHRTEEVTQKYLASLGQDHLDKERQKALEKFGL